jgi:uncharacterized membrane protein YeaQ/YmgE (transglycosylase-associated protein family)
MYIVGALIVGLVAGALAKLVMPGRDPGGIFVTTILGILGSILASFLGSSLGLYHPNDAGPGLIASVIGAVLVLVVYRFVRRTPVM